jgi:hypothetical protein
MRAMGNGERGDGENVDPATLARIRERTLEAERKQLHKRKPHNIIPEIETIIREEIDE